MRKYDVPDAEDLTNSNVQGLYPNYPYNDLRPDMSNFDNFEAIKSASSENKGFVEFRLESNNSVCNLFAGEIKIMPNLRY